MPFIPVNELERLAIIQRFLNFEINEDKELQEIIELAAAFYEVPIAFISAMDSEIQYLRFKVGIKISQSKRKDSICQFTIQSRELMIVPDTLLDPRFVDNVFVKEQEIRFYAGAPLITHDGHVLGTLCVLDKKPRQFNDIQKRMIQEFARRIIQIMEFDCSIRLLKKQYVEVKSAEVKLRSFFNSSASCHLLIGTELEILAFNKNIKDHVAKMFNVQLFAGIRLDQVLKGKPLDRFAEECRLALGGMSIHYERQIRYKNGDVIWWEVSLVLGYDQDGAVIGVSWNASDITERKLYEEKIIAQNNSLKQIAHIQSHELRGPVASILGLVNLITEDNYVASKEDILMLGKAAVQLDSKIQTIVQYTY